jgi:hypothetical protein
MLLAFAVAEIKVLFGGSGIGNRQDSLHRTQSLK